MNVVTGDDGLDRCEWATSTQEYVAYHDEEWGYPVSDDNRLFEKLCLEGFQAGLAWITILRKRDNFRKAFYDFEIARVAQMTPADVDGLMGDAGIVRHRGKIRSTINNAARTQELIEEAGSLAAFVWAHEPAASSVAATQTPESVALSKALKQRGFTFVGPTTAYAFMQAMGLVNDHVEGCYVREEVAAARASFDKPVSR